MAEESCALAVDANALAPLGLSKARVLARKSTADAINGIEDRMTCSGEASDVGKTKHSWPPVLQSVSAPFVDLAERDGSHPGSFESEAEAANS